MFTSSTHYPAIVGAGPVGLTARLLLARAGISTRIIDSAQQRSRHSRALAVNPRTLELLETTGVTERMLKLGRPIHGVKFWRGTRPIAELSFATLKHRFPYMLALSQAVTERLLEEKLASLGISVERGVSLVSCNPKPDHIEAELCKTSDDFCETVSAPWVLATDGAHSTVRDELNVAFKGTTFREEWHLADLPLRTSLASDSAHVFFLEDGGFVFIIRVIEGEKSEPSAIDGAQLWRVMGNVSAPIGRLPLAKSAGPTQWTSSFHISHRINARLQLDRVYFAGDSAHVHSPVGARGMNLGIEDAWVFCELIKRDKLSRYEKVRKSVDHKVVRRIEFLSRVARGESRMARFARAAILPKALEIGPIHERFQATVTGLDHDIDVEGN